MFNSEHLQEKWQPVLNHPDLPEITDAYKRAVTSVILENQEQELKKDQSMMLSEAQNVTGDSTSMSNWDPILISLVRRSMPNLMAYDVCGVQPMSGPTGLIFAMKSRYNGPNTGATDEALFDEADSAGISADLAVLPGSGVTRDSFEGAEPGVLNDSPGTAPATNTGTGAAGAWGDTTKGVFDSAGGMTAAEGEATGSTTAKAFMDMGFSIEKSTVTARTRALRASYTMELAQDLKAIHGLDAESELSNILSTEILSEINREVVRTIYTVAVKGAIATSSAGIFDMDVDANGRWSVEKFKGLIFQIERDCNDIGIKTRRGKGNILMCSADVASALSMAGALDVGGNLGAGNLNVDPSPAGSTFVGTIGGRIKVHVDPYNSVVSASQANNWYVAGYRGSSAYDAGLFYCPYVPLQMVRAVSEADFQPRIAFKTRYGMAANPMAQAGVESTEALVANTNNYYRRVRVSNLM